MNISVVIPCFRVKAFILDVISNIGPDIYQIIVVDDGCTEQSGQYVVDNCQDHRVTVVFHQENLGVGGATITGYRQALNTGADIIVKVDGDGQMDPALIPQLIRPIVEGRADYAKGNRFYDVESLTQMPKFRIFGNAGLSFLTKLSSGYWDVFDPTNGFTAIHKSVLAHLPLDKIEERFFFESDILFRLNTIRAVVADVPMDSKYGEEESNLKVLWTIPEFLFKHLRNFSKRLFYNYYLRDFSVASLEILLGVSAVLFGGLFGAIKWYQGTVAATPVSSGTVMLAALPIIIGVQLCLAFVNYDVQNVPRNPLHQRLPK